MKDAATTVTVYEELLKLRDNRQEIYIDYADSLVALTNIPLALKVMERAIEKSDDK